MKTIVQFESSPTSGSWSYSAFKTVGLAISLAMCVLVGPAQAVSNSPTSGKAPNFICNGLNCTCTGDDCKQMPGSPMCGGPTSCNYVDGVFTCICVESAKARQGGSGGPKSQVPTAPQGATGNATKH